jgi:hypothetical protein
MSIADVLERAADLIEPEGAWTQHEWALGANGEEDPIGPAVCWCAWGAIYEASGRDWTPVANQAVQAVQAHLDAEIQQWNDAPGRTQAEVVASLREAAAKARQQEQFS